MYLPEVMELHLLWCHGLACVYLLLQVFFQVTETIRKSRERHGLAPNILDWYAPALKIPDAYGIVFRPSGYLVPALTLPITCIT